jgi:signal transduction histidine kinase
MENKPKILMVDDRIENLIALETVLKDMDVELIKATSGNEALKHVLHHHFALALIDIQMPDMDGYELATILREEEQTANLPFIFISAVYTDHINIFKGYEKGAFGFINKPFQPEILINKVKLFVDIYRHEEVLKKLNQNLEAKNEELKFLNHELEAFTYSVSHDLRAPLRSVKGYSQILLEEHSEEFKPEVKDLLAIINTNAQRMDAQIENLLSFSKLGRREVKKTKVDMGLLVNELIEEIKSFKETGDIKWCINNLYSCYADPLLLKHVWTNLISNAVKYSSKKEKPEIIIGSEVTEHEYIYFVKDNGAGFDMKYVEKLFGVFQRLHKSTEFEGTGVGLAIVHKIITRHGGWVRAEGEVNNGAAFYFSIPVI